MGVCSNGLAGLHSGAYFKYVSSGERRRTHHVSTWFNGLSVFASSAYVLTTRKNLSFMTGFLMVGMLVAFIAAIANMFLQILAVFNN